MAKTSQVHTSFLGGLGALGTVYREEMTTISHVPCATSARGWCNYGEVMLACFLPQLWVQLPH